MNAPAPNAVTTQAPRPRHRMTVPREGEGGLYSQTWFPVCTSAEVAPGQVIGVPFLGGKVVVFRGEDGVARVMSAWCVHMGADLSVGKVVGNHIRCAFHHWEYGDQGTCMRTATGSMPPKGAGIFHFPTAEKLGCIWAFNGEAPLWELPDLEVPEAQCDMRVRPCLINNCEPYMITANAFDWQHFGILHHFESDTDMGEDAITWNPYDCGFVFKGRHWLGEDTTYRIWIHGTNLYLQQGTLDGVWYALMYAMGLPEPGRSRTFMHLWLPRSDTPEGRVRDHYRIEALLDMELRFVDEDEPILNNIHFGPTHLTKDDKAFGLYLNWLRRYPRANPAMHYLD
jgi:phenylpropionate dioxygenase-like ring-hydroxylating dioxygenase large terminal subunit